MSEVTINEEQKYYVIPAGDGWSTLGFDNAFKKASAIADAIAAVRPDLAGKALDQKPDAADWGTMSVYNAYQNLAFMLASEKIDLGTWYDPDTAPEVKRQLDLAIKGGYRLRIEYGDSETGQVHGDMQMAGYISRSTGVLKTPILVKTNRSHGGEPLLTASIVSITETPGGRRLWQHPTYTPTHALARTA